MTLKEVKDAFFQSECGQYIREGVGVSEPIPRLVNDRMIDVFFIYKINRDTDQYTSPLVRFGIVADEKRMEFAEAVTNLTGDKSTGNSFNGSGNRKERMSYYHEYEAAYNKARDLFYCRCTDGDKETVETYWKTFQKYVDPYMVKYYVEAVPEFFSWIQTICH